MNPKHILHHRLLNQHIVETHFTRPEQIVSHLTAMQSQDWAMAKWAIGLRLPGSKEADIELAFNEGRILRTHVLRPTWHFITPADIRSVLLLTAPRVQTFNALYYKKKELDAKVFSKCNNLLTKALRDHHYQTRNELKEVLAQGKIITDNIRLSYIMMNAELEGLVCSGPRKGKQFTYALLDEKTPPVTPFIKEVALQDLASRYFATRSPATIHDFTWWSGLTVKEAREAIGILDSTFKRIRILEKEYIFHDHPLTEIKKGQATFLVPDYDEYGISYKDRTMYNHPKYKHPKSVILSELYHAIGVDGYFGGHWKRTVKGNKLVIEAFPFDFLTKTQRGDVDKAVKKYIRFFS